MSSSTSSKLPACPFPGLRPFRSSEAAIFFGRDQQIDDMLSKLEDHRFLAVVGASGSGKSSLVRAGLLPALHDGFLSTDADQWRMVVMRPGRGPFEQLVSSFLNQFFPTSSDSQPDSQDTKQASANLPPTAGYLKRLMRSGPSGFIDALHETNLRDPDIAAPTNVLLLVDQFEEIFRFRDRYRDQEDQTFDADWYDQRNDATAFVNLLLHSVSHDELQVYVILTMRSDFLGDCDAFLGLPELVSDGQFLTPRLSRVQLTEAIRGPLRLFGNSISNEAVNLILSGVGTNPDQLPLMQHALTRMWLRHGKRQDSDGELTVKDYTQVGGLQQALAQHANEIYKHLTPDQQRIADKLFRLLCDHSNEGRLVRRLTSIAEVANVCGVDWKQVVPVIEAFSSADANFLVVTSSADELSPAADLDISHEALMRQWPRLIGWIEDEQKGADLYHDVVRRAERFDREEGDFLRSPELESITDWDVQFAPNPPWAKRYGGDFERFRSFLDTSISLQEGVNRRERIIRYSLTFAFVVTVILLVYSIVQGRRADREAAAAIVARIRADYARKEVEDTLKNVEREKNRADAEAALARRNLLTGELATVDTLLATDKPHDALMQLQRADLLAFEHNDVRRASIDYRLAHAARLSLGFVHGGPVYSVAFSPDGKTVLTGSDDNTARLWDAETGQFLRVAPFQHALRIRAVAISPDGQTVITGSADHTARLWDAATGEPQGNPLTHDDQVLSVAFSHDGTIILTGSSDNTARLWSVETGSPVTEPLQHDGMVYAVAFAPDDQTVLTGSHDGEVRRWNVSTGDLIGKPLTHPAPVTSLTESQDGSIVLTGCADGTARIWEAKTGKLQERSFKHPNRGNDRAILVVALSPDGKVVLTGSEDNTRVWDRETGRLRGEPLQHGGDVHGVAFSPDGATFLTSSGGDTVELWDTATRILLATVLEPYVGIPPAPQNEGFVYPPSNVAIAFTPDGQQVFYSSNERLLRHELLPPVANEPERLRLSIELRSLMTETEFGQLRPLTVTEYIAKHKRLQELGGDCAVRKWSDLSHAELDAVAGRK